MGWHLITGECPHRPLQQPPPKTITNDPNNNASPVHTNYTHGTSTHDSIYAQESVSLCLLHARVVCQIPCLVCLVWRRRLCVFLTRSLAGAYPISNSFLRIPRSQTSLSPTLQKRLLSLLFPSFFLPSFLPLHSYPSPLNCPPKPHAVPSIPSPSPDYTLPLYTRLQQASSKPLYTLFTTNYYPTTLQAYQLQISHSQLQTKITAV